MATIVLFHSVLGLRAVEQQAAERMRGAGHDVVTPDLYAGLTAPSVDEGLDLMGKVGWEIICGRARAALLQTSRDAVLAGHSMGAGVVSAVWPERIAAAGVVLLHGLADIPTNVRRHIPVAVHVADPDTFALPEQVAGWSAAAKRCQVKAEIFTYPGIGHFYTDRALPDYNAPAAELTWSRVLAFLETIARKT
ncbi:dienelactone hydrolase family protein [Mesorhizobium sp. M2A.F.Ca.ET.043.05.1.1]|uniref:dienelactone hydrolase family protein n=1 Tax=Mesorhizobium sp. M2A.F.Ca.ET.043.05.1.1 TaxID=2493671 RepID=UPI000F76203D|nr:dienelactone hydrolase family protein [Mesorhizobium sp. M2A.F.Ca.ET.043.05.1.1]AZO15570.1 dienelactone hydrolase family protein [Mesorhizobium sp. M2A.F.Ca.ET.043.05.1.1]